MLIGALEPDLALETLGVFLKNLATPEILSTTSHQCYLSNNYLSHAYLSSFQPCVGCIWHEFLYFANVVSLALVYALSNIEGVRIPCCAHCIQMQNSNLCTYLGELPHFI